MKDDRYQNQSFIVKLFRCRYYLLVPFKTLRDKIKNPKEPMSLLYSINIGMAQVNMKHYYTCQEMMKRYE